MSRLLYLLLRIPALSLQAFHRRLQQTLAMIRLFKLLTFRSWLKEMD